MNAGLKTTWFWVFSLLFIVTGCVAPSNPFVGNTVSSAPVVALQSGGPHADSWQTFDIAIDYEYKQDGDVFEIQGAAVLSQRYEIMYSQLRDLRVYLFFLDDNSRVLEASMIARSLTMQIDQKLQFNHLFKAPPGTTRISFGYDGRVSENEDYHSFYLLPLNR